MNANWLALAETATLLAMLILLAIFVWVYHRKPGEFSALWIFGWSLYALRLAFGVWNALAGPALPLTIAYYEASALSSIILLRAVLKDVKGESFRVWDWLAFAGVSAWIIWGAYIARDLFWLSLPTFFFFGATQILSGYYFLAKRGAYIGARLAGWGFVLWGLHKLDYPFLRPMEWFAPIGYIIGAFLSIIIGIGVLTLLFERSEERLALALEATQDGVWDTDLKTGSAYFSPAYFSMLGYAPGEISTAQWDRLIHPEDREAVLTANRECVENLRERFEVEFRMKAADGAWKWILARGKAAQRDERGRALRLIGAHTDITARKQAEEEIRELNVELERRVEERTRELLQAQEQLLRVERFALLEKIAGGIGRQLRDPLGIVSNAVYYLKAAQADAEPKIKEYLDVIEGHVYISDMIVSNLLSFVGEGFGAAGAISASQTIQQTLKRFPPPQGVQALLDLPPNLPQARVNARQYIQILSNLLQNAYQAMPAGGEISIRCRIAEGWLLTTVADNGVGIPPENMEKLFEPLFTTKPQGTGLGLAVVKKLAEAAGGRIEVQSPAGKGSAFNVYLPIVEP